MVVGLPERGVVQSSRPQWVRRGEGPVRPTSRVAGPAPHQLCARPRRRPPYFPALNSSSGGGGVPGRGEKTCPGQGGNPGCTLATSEGPRPPPHIGRPVPGGLLFFCSFSRAQGPQKHVVPLPRARSAPRLLGSRDPGRVGQVRVHLVVAKCQVRAASPTGTHQPTLAQSREPFSCHEGPPTRALAAAAPRICYVDSRDAGARDGRAAPAPRPTRPRAGPGSCCVDAEGRSRPAVVAASVARIQSR